MNNRIIELLDETMDDTLDGLLKRPPKVVALALVMMCVEHELGSNPEKYQDKDLKTLLEDACKGALTLTDGIYLEIPSSDKETIH
jgi:hypothetical protein